MTDYPRLTIAADWRREQIEKRLDNTTALNQTQALLIQRSRLERFIDFCLLAQEFDHG